MFRKRFGNVFDIRKYSCFFLSTTHISQCNWIVDRRKQLHFLISKTLPKRFRSIDCLKSTTATELQLKLERRMAPLLQAARDVQLVAFDGEEAIDYADFTFDEQFTKWRSIYSTHCRVKLHKKL